MNTQNQKKDKNILRTVLKKITFKNTIKFLFVLIIVTVYTLLLGRMYLAGNRGVMNEYSPTQKYLSECNNSSEILTQNIMYSMDEDGLFHISNLVIIPEIGELQINARYNNSTLDFLEKHYPDAEYIEEPFIYELIDENGKSYPLNGYIARENIIYNFRKLLFENVDLSNCKRLYLRIMYVGDKSYDSPMTVKFNIYNSEIDNIQSKLKIGSKKFDNFIR